MQYVGRALGSVSKTWNSINPATLSGAIDVIVIEQENGDLNCSPFHVRFGKFSTLRPSQKKVQLTINGDVADLPMKLGEGGEAFFVFETDEPVPDSLITSPVISPSSSPGASPDSSPLHSPTTAGTDSADIPPDYLESNANHNTNSAPRSRAHHAHTMSMVSPSTTTNTSTSTNNGISNGLPTSSSETALGEPEFLDLADSTSTSAGTSAAGKKRDSIIVEELTRKFTDQNIPSVVGDNGDIVLDMTGYKSTGQGAKESEQKVRDILENELGLDPSTLEHMIALDHEGKLRISSPEPATTRSHRSESLSTPSPLHHYSSDPTLRDFGSATTTVPGSSGIGRRDSNASLDSNSSVTSATTAIPTSSSRNTTPPPPTSADSANKKNYVKTLRLTSDQLKSLNLRLGKNEISFSVNQGKAVCTGNIFYWNCTAPIVISDIDGTITKSDALGHVFTMIGRDWTHLGVGKLFTDIRNNGYNIMYLTSRSVGQADTTRWYLRSVDQDGFKLPEGPVILSPDRTMAALRREVIMRKPEIFKMACLRDIQSLYGDRDETPFYAGFGNRITDALSYRSVGVPKSKIFTINSNSEVHMELLELAGYKSSYVNIADLVDHFFPPVSSKEFHQVQQTFTDVNFWREPIPDVSDLEEEEENDQNNIANDDDEDDEDYQEAEEGDDEDDDDEDDYDEYEEYSDNEYNDTKPNQLYLDKKMAQVGLS